MGRAKGNQQGMVQRLRADNTWEMLPPLSLKSEEREQFPSPGERLQERVA